MPKKTFPEERCSRHIQNLLDVHHLKYKFIDDDPDMSGYNIADCSVEIPKPVAPYNYFVCLHEISHALLKHQKPKTWDDEVRMEIEANELMLKMTIIKAPPSVRKQFEDNRIKGSWER